MNSTFYGGGHAMTTYPRAKKMAFLKSRKMPRIGYVARQKGVSLFVVLVILLLALVVVLGALAVGNIHESAVGNQADHQRTYAAAEALLNAGQQDILLNNGLYCQSGGLGESGTNNTLKQSSGAASECVMRYPANATDYMQLINNSSFIGGLNHCGSTDTFRGVCISESPTKNTFTTTAVNNGGAQVLSNGAGYHQFSATLDAVKWGGDTQIGVDAGSKTSLTLGDGSATQNFRGVYWVEIFPYNSMSAAITGGMPANVPVPDSMFPFIFRITAMAQGLRGGSVAVLRMYYVPYPCTSNSVVGESCS
jgi:type IV pilus assembly protein PilX